METESAADGGGGQGGGQQGATGEGDARRGGEGRRTVGGAELDHVDARDGEELLEVLHRLALLDHQRAHRVVLSLHPRRRATLPAAAAQARRGEPRTKVSLQRCGG